VYRGENMPKGGANPEPYLSKRRRMSVWHRFVRLMRYRLIIPILRARHEPEYTARGVFVGVAWGFTPTVGLQMPIVFVIWSLIRVLTPRWNFNLVVGLAWVWISNVFTLVPMYFGFLVTGRILMGHQDSLPGYEIFSNELMAALAVETDGLSGFWQQSVNLFDLYGAPMLIGCVPWALIGGWVSYSWTAAYLRRRQRLAAARRRARGEAEDMFKL
jgi:uncharacterized protein